MVRSSWEITSRIKRCKVTYKMKIINNNNNDTNAIIIIFAINIQLTFHPRTETTSINYHAFLFSIIF